MASSTLISTPSYREPSTTIRPILTVNWRLLISRNGDLYLHHVPLLSTDRGEEVLNKLFEEYKNSQSWFINIVPFLVPVICRATLSPIPIEDISQQLPRIVDIDFEHRVHVLTYALHHSATLPPTTDFTTSYSCFAVIDEVPGNVRARDALLIRLELNKIFLLLFLITSLVISVVLGVLVGALRHSVDTGLGICAGILGAVGIIEGFMTWRLK